MQAIGLLTRNIRFFYLRKMAGLGGLEPPTAGFGVPRSAN